MPQGCRVVKNVLKCATIQHHVKTSPHIFGISFIEIVQVVGSLKIAVIGRDDLPGSEKPKQFVRVQAGHGNAIQTAINFFRGPRETKIMHGLMQLPA